MRKKGSVAVILVVLLTIFGFNAVDAQAHDDESRQFVHRYRPGEEYRIVGVNRQELTVDGRSFGEAEVLTRVLITVQEPDRGQPEGAGRLTASYQVSDEAVTGSDVFQFQREYDVELLQDRRGYQTVPRGSFVPQVRDIPVFPEDPVSPGDTWTAGAYEVYDFREGIGVEEPVVIPVDVQYEYLGPREFEGRSYDAIAVRYSLFHRPRPGRPEASEIRLMTARFSQELLWDYLAGRAHYYEETYNLFIQLSDGTRTEYQGRADGRIVEAPPLDRDRLREDIEEAIRDDGIDDTTVRSDEDGVTVSLEDIRFAPDSAVLMEEERRKIRWLAGILNRYPQRDILVSGHTALAGSEEGRQRLSEERAAAVAEYLVELGARSRENVMIRGYGARVPLGDNNTEEGRRRNRRVEITILEN
jgi:outer membrane protein OmpA-like peptidoglycan-associated protein